MGPYDWNNQGPGSGHWMGILLFMIVFWALLAAVVIYAVRRFMHPHDSHHPHGGHHPPGAGSGSESAVEILKTRFAKGEIDEEEFTRRLKLLKGEH